MTSLCLIIVIATAIPWAESGKDYEKLSKIMHEVKTHVVLTEGFPAADIKNVGQLSKELVDKETCWESKCKETTCSDKRRFENCKTHWINLHKIMEVLLGCKVCKPGVVKKNYKTEVDVISLIDPIMSQVKPHPASGSSQPLLHYNNVPNLVEHLKQQISKFKKGQGKNGSELLSAWKAVVNECSEYQWKGCCENTPKHS